MARGWWKFSIEMDDDFKGEVSESSLEYIVDCIKQGYTSGEVIEEEEEEDDEEEEEEEEKE